MREKRHLDERDGAVLGRLRWTERGLPGVQEVWKLWGAGSVGSQALVGIPVVAHLRFDTEFQPMSRVWPFETGFTPRPTSSDGPFVLHAEIWPGIVPKRQDRNIIKDQAQVRDLTAWLSDLDEAGTLGQYFDHSAGLPDEGVVAATTEEGWIVGHPEPPVACQRPRQEDIGIDTARSNQRSRWFRCRHDPGSAG